VLAPIWGPEIEITPRRRLLWGTIIGRVALERHEVKPGALQMKCFVGPTVSTLEPISVQILRVAFWAGPSPRPQKPKILFQFLDPKSVLALEGRKFHQ